MLRAMREGLARRHRRQERHVLRQARGDDLAIAALVGRVAGADDQRAEPAPLRLQQRQRVEIDVDALQVAQHADIEEVRGVGRRGTGSNSSGLSPLRTTCAGQRGTPTFRR